MKLFEIGEAIVKGVLEIPVDLYYGGRRTMEDVGLFGAEVRQQNAEERDRVGALIAQAVRNRQTLQRLIEVIVFDFLDKLPESTQSKLNDSLSLSGVKFTSKKAAQFTLSAYLGKKLTEKIVTRVVAKRLAKFGVGLAISAVLIQGMIERASNASQRLAKINPGLFAKLKAENLDMIYFLAEEELAPFVTTDALQIRDPSAYDAFLQKLDSTLQ